MGRAIVVAVMVLLGGAVARADPFDDAKFDDAVDGVASLVGPCQDGLDHANQLLDAPGDLGQDELAEVEKDRDLLAVLCPMLRDDAAAAKDTLSQLRACTGDCSDLALSLQVTLDKATSEIGGIGTAVNEVDSIAAGEGFVPDGDEGPTEIAPVYTGSDSAGSWADSTEHMGSKPLALSTIGVSIDGYRTWEVRAGDGADLISQDGVDIAAVMPQAEDDCATTIAGLANTYPEHRDATISLLAAWSGLEYAVDGAWGGLYCRTRVGSAVIVSASPEVATVLIAGIEAALSPSVTATDAADGTAGPTPETPHAGHRLIGGFLPRTVQLGLVRRADDVGAGFGVGLQLGRLGWREHQRFTIGYEVDAAAASGFWELGAQVRPAVSPMAKDLPVDAYVALGVDALGGKHQPESDVAAVGGVGAEVMFTLPGLGADLAGQVLADPGGFHSYTLHGGLLIGPEAKAKLRLGTDYVRRADDSSVLWFTLGLTAFELD